VSVASAAPVQKPPSAPQPSPILPAEAADAIDRAVLAAIAEGKLPGCVVVIGRKDTVVFARPYGYRALVPERERATLETVYDLASLTKPIATATSVMLLASDGRIDLDAPVSRYLPELKGGGKETITTRQLLLHTSGLVVETPIADYAAPTPAHPTSALQAIAATRLRSAPGEVYRYSDAGFIVLGELVERVSGEPLDVFAKTRIFTPLGMRDTGFLPPPDERARAALTEAFDGEWMQGVVHDPRARIAGGVLGHAGVFSTAEDLVLYAQALLREGGGVLPASLVQSMLAPHDVPAAVRALGWDVRSVYSTNRGMKLSPRAVGHGGYTGTSLWIDPEKDLFVLLLSNRVHPDGKGAVNPLAGRIADIAAVALEPAPSIADTGVATGIDVLVAEKFARLRGAHVGLVTNATGKSKAGGRTIDLLRGAEGVSLVALFAPEHGLSTDKDEGIVNGVDAATGLPVYSLYRVGSKAGFEPTAESLSGIDTIVFDIADAGSRFFTYASTLEHVMKTVASRGLRLVVLDRPNPIGGIDVQGPVLTGETRSFVNHHALPVRHGMTMGELAVMFDADLHLGTKLEVVRMKGWNRATFYDETGLSWTNPSPNLRSTDEALLYDGIGLLEGTNLAVGRGTDTPFEVVGAPFVDGDALLGELQKEALPGVRFAKATFTPTASKFKGEACSGVRIQVTDRHAIDPVKRGLTLAVVLHRLQPAEWRVDQLEGMVGDKGVVAALTAGGSYGALEALWRGKLLTFRAKREKYILY
jgi:uncharacterized protein YbbC (DUF1343 family)/CubicO group peptidase (beta-lactamase class C family)